MAVWLTVSPGRAADIQRPRLYFGPQDVTALRERAAREPYATFYRHYKRLLDDEISPPDPELDAALIETQIGALVHLVSGKVSYAGRARRALLDRLRVWESQIPDYHPGNDRSPISLTVSRRLQNLCTDFDLLAASGVFTPAERVYVRDTLAMVVSRLMERGDSFNPYDYLGERFRCDNWNTDRFVAVGMYALTFPDHENSQAWLNHAVEEMTWQLDHTLLPDGAWPEGTRYHGAVLRSMIPFAYALRRNAGIDFFERPRFKGMFESLLHVQTLPATLADGAALLPGVGDANWENIWTAVLGWAAPAYAKSDPAFAGRLMWAWRRGGAPFVVEFSPGNPIAGFLFIDADLKPIPQPALTSDLRPGGYAVLRDGFDQPHESFFLFNVSTSRRSFQHQHHDRGSFSLWAWGAPLAVDPGVRDYAESLGAWFIRSRAHNQVVFANADARGGGGEITDFLPGDWIDYVRADLTRSVGADYHRQIFFLKPDACLIWDRLDAAKPAVYHLHVLTDQDREPVPAAGGDDAADHVRFTCLNDVNLDLWVLSPARAVGEGLIELDRDPCPVSFHVERHSVPMMVHAQTPWWLKLRQADVGDDFVTLLHVRKGDAKPVEVRDLTRNDTGFQFDLRFADRRMAVHLGPRDDHGIRLDGEAAVVMQRDADATNEVFLAGTRTFISPDGLSITWPERRTTTIRKRDGDQVPRTFVRPIDWMRFARSVPVDPDREACRDLLLHSARYNLAWIDRAFRTDPKTGAYVLETMEEHGIRPACSIVYALATLLQTGSFDPAVVGTDEKAATAATLKLLRGITASHAANSALDKKWGDAWQSALWAALAGAGGWMLWDELDDPLRSELAAMIVHEADRFVGYRVPYWDGRDGDTKGEENAWNSMILSLAGAMMPAHPHGHAWSSKCSELMVSAYATEADRLANATVLDGRTVTQWLHGYNALDGGVVLNHGFEHPDYMAAETMNLWGFLMNALAGQPPPEATDFKGRDIYRTFITLDWPSPPFEPPGGTIYRPDEPNVYYPRGVDWSTYDVSPYYLIDVWAHVLGWDDGLPRPALHWMRLRADRMKEMQSRHPDGHMFAPGEYDTYSGAEQWIAWCLTDAALALWLDAHDAIDPPATTRHQPPNGT